MSNARKKKLICIVIVVCAVLWMLVVCSVLYYKLCMDPYRGTVKNREYSKDLDETLSVEEALEDLEYMMERFRNHHPAWLEEDNAAVAAVEAQYVTEVAAIEALYGTDTATTQGVTSSDMSGTKGEISVLELYQAASRIAAKMHDGHTYPYWNGEEVLYIHDFTQINEYGAPLTIDGVPVADVLEAYKQVTAYELDFYVENQFETQVIVNEYALRLCGVDTSDGVIMTFDDGAGAVEYHYGFVPIAEVKGYEYSEEEKPWVYYEIDEENSVGIFTLTTCMNNEEYRSVLENFFAEVFAGNIENVVVDLRYNGGGNSWVANEFITYLDVEEYQSWDSGVRFGWYLLENKDIVYKNKRKEQVFDGQVYVLTNIKTYSAAMDFAMLIADNDLGIIVGEPSGNLPDSYGDILSFQMPNSKLMLCVSHKRWYRIDQSKSGQPIMPDYEVEGSEALEKVYELIGE